MNETKKFDKWIGVLSVSIISIVAIVFVILISDNHLDKGTYAAETCSDPNATFSTFLGTCVCKTGYTYDSNSVCVPKGASSSSSKPSSSPSSKPSCTYSSTTEAGNAGKSDCGEGNYNVITSGGCVSYQCKSSGPKTCSQRGMFDTASTCGPNCSNGNCVKSDDCFACRPNTCLTKTQCNAAAAASTADGGCNGSFTGCTSPVSGTDCYTYTCVGNPDAPQADCYCGSCDGNTWKVSNVGKKDQVTCNKSCQGGTPGWGKLPETKQCGTTSNPSAVVTGMCYCNVCIDKVWQYSTLGTTTQANCKGTCTGTITWGSKLSGTCGSNGGGGNGGGDTPTPSNSENTPTPSNSENTPTPSNNGGGGSNSDTNPQTGTTGIIMAWVIGLMAIGYSFWYFKRTSTN